MKHLKFSLSTLLLWLLMGATGMALTFNFPRQLDAEKILHDSDNSPFLSERTTHVGYGVPFENRAKDYVITDPTELKYVWVESVSPWSIAGNLLFYFGFVAIAPFIYLKYVRWAKEHDPYNQESTS